MDEEPVSAMAEFLADLGSVATAVWDQVTTAAETITGTPLLPAEAIDAFVAKKLKGAAVSDPKELKKVSDALARRGYSWSDISEALRRYGAQWED